MTTLRSSRSRGLKRCALLHVTVTIITGYLYRLSDFTVDVAIAVGVLTEVTVYALHSEINVNILEMHGFFELLWVAKRDDPAIFVQEVALPITLEYSAKVPAMSVVVGELRCIKFRIKLTHPLEEIEVRPLSSDSRLFGVVEHRGVCLLCGWIALLLRPHGGGIALVIPHGVANIGVHEHIWLMHVTHHALTCWYRPREDVLQRMALLVFRYSWIDCLAFSLVPKSRVRS